MSKIRFEQTRFGAFLQSKGFYIALGVCLLAVGAAAWTTVSTFSTPSPLGAVDSSRPSDSQQQSAPPAASQTWPVDGLVSGIPDSGSRPSADSEEAVSTQPANTNPDAKAEATSFTLPLKGEITKAFSATELQFSETYQDYRLHPGTDIAGDANAAITAAGDGTVTDIYTDSLWGTTIVIDHGKGITAFYSGLQKSVSVKKGDSVKRGQQIGGLERVPCEGSEAPHLHFSMKQDGKWVNPIEMMSKK